MEQLKRFFDVASLGAAFAAFVDWLPAMAAGASLVWTVIRIYETKTVQGWLNRKGKRK